MNAFERLEDLKAQRYDVIKQVEQVNKDFCKLKADVAFDTIKEQKELASKLKDLNQLIIGQEGFVFCLSIFQVEDIAPLLEEIISKYEAGNYFYREVFYKYSDGGREKIRVIVEENSICEEYDSISIDKLKSDRKVLVLPGEASLSYTCFYDFDGSQINPIDSLISFDYLRRFIDMAICHKEKFYRKADYVELKNQFIRDNADEIVNRCAKKDEQVKEGGSSLNQEVISSGGTGQKIKKIMPSNDEK